MADPSSLTNDPTNGGGMSLNGTPFLQGTGDTPLGDGNPNPRGQCTADTRAHIAPHGASSTPRRTLRRRSSGTVSCCRHAGSSYVVRSEYGNPRTGRERLDLHGQSLHRLAQRRGVASQLQQHHRLRLALDAAGDGETRRIRSNQRGLVNSSQPRNQRRSKRRACGRPLRLRPPMPRLTTQQRPVRRMPRTRQPAAAIGGWHRPASRPRTQANTTASTSQFNAGQFNAALSSARHCLECGGPNGTADRGARRMLQKIQATTAQQAIAALQANTSLSIQDSSAATSTQLIAGIQANTSLSNQQQQDLDQSGHRRPAGSTSRPYLGTAFVQHNSDPAADCNAGDSGAGGREQYLQRRSSPASSPTHRCRSNSSRPSRRKIIAEPQPTP